MGFNCGIVGLPNVGKSTLFNALTKTAAAEAANYPFCTIEPNTGRVAVPDQRLEQLAMLAKSSQILPTQLEFVDIAGLVKGASKGEGLGNQFLSHIREVDAILHVLRCFEDKEITHVNNIIDPISDKEIIDTELILSDLNSLEKQMNNFLKEGLGDYSHGRNFPNKPNVSRISPYLHWGQISPNTLWYEAERFQQDVETINIDIFKSELGWREFFYNLMFG